MLFVQIFEQIKTDGWIEAFSGTVEISFGQRWLNPPPVEKMSGTPMYVVYGLSVQRDTVVQEVG